MESLPLRWLHDDRNENREDDAISETCNWLLVEIREKTIKKEPTSSTRKSKWSLCHTLSAEVEWSPLQLGTSECSRVHWGEAGEELSTTWCSRECNVAKRRVSKRWEQDGIEQRYGGKRWTPDLQQQSKLDNVIDSISLPEMTHLWYAAAIQSYVERLPHRGRTTT